MSNLENKLKEFLQDLHEFNGPWPFEGPVDIRSRNAFGDLPIHLAVMQGDLAAVLALLAAGADVNARGEDEMTPLHLAATRGLDLVKALLDAGADPRVVDAFGSTPADRARSLERSDELAALASWINRQSSRDDDVS